MTGRGGGGAWGERLRSLQAEVASLLGSYEQSEAVHGCTSGTPLEEGGACGGAAVTWCKVAGCYKGQGPAPERG